MTVGDKRNTNSPVAIHLALCSAGEIYGGIEEFIYGYSRHITKNTDIDCLVILFHEGLLSEKLRAAGVRVSVVHSSFKYDPTLPFRIASILRRDNINIVHTHGYKANIIAGIAAKLSGIKTVKTEHGMQESNRGLRDRIMSANLIIDRLITRAAVDELVYVTSDIMHRSHTSGQRARQTVIHNGIPSIPVNNENGKSKDKKHFNIGIVGRIDEVKGHIHLIRAIESLRDIPDIQLCVFGDGPLRGRLETYCRDNGISDRVLFKGFVTDIYEQVRALDVFVMPSLHEGLPYALLEAMYLKTPIVASSVGGLKEVLENDVTAILTTPCNHEEIAAAIRRLHDDRKVGDKLAQNAYDTVCSDFSIEAMYNQYRLVYDRCVAAG